MTWLHIAIAIQFALLAGLLGVLIRRERAEGARRESDASIRLMLDATPAMLWTARPDSTLDYLNKRCAIFTGMPIEKLRGEGWLEAMHADDVDEVLAKFNASIEARVAFNIQYRMRRADGAWRTMLAMGIPKYEADGSFSGYAGCDVDITERKQAEDQIRASQVELESSHQEIQQLAGRLISAHEDERRRLARELHDDLTQRLARLAIDAGQLEGSPGAREGMTALRKDLVRLSEDVHALSYRLHPAILDDLGLVEALRAECDRVARRAQLRVHLDERDVPQALPGDASLCLFRVAQEALSNASRHARASVVTLSLSPRNAGLQLVVNDNGRGFDPGRSREHASLGLASMRERVRQLQGELDIESSPGSGTTVVAWVPA